jgi:hypothetical protein
MAFGSLLRLTGVRSMRQANSARAITRDRYDAVLFDLDGATPLPCTPHVGNGSSTSTCRSVRTREAKNFAPSISPMTIGSM